MMPNILLRDLNILITLAALFACSGCTGVPRSESETYNGYEGVMLNTSVYVVLTTHFEGVVNLANKTESLSERIKSMRSVASSVKVSIDIDHEIAGLAKDKAWPDFDNLLVELEKDGHSIGLHGSFCGAPGTCDDKKIFDFVNDAHSKMKAVLPRSFKHLSGVCSDADWVAAAIKTGLPVISGVIRHCRLSLDTSNPLHLNDTQCSDPSKCHGPYRYELERLLHPLTASSGSNWTNSSSTKGALIVTQVSSFADMDEMLGIRGGTPGDGGKFKRSKDLDSKDVVAVKTLLDHAIRHAALHSVGADGNPVRHVFVIGSSWGTYLKDIYDDFYDELAKLVHDNPNLAWVALDDL